MRRTFSLAADSFKEFIKLLYIEKNATLFKGVLKLPLPKNVQAWRKAVLMDVFNFLGIASTDEQGKSLTVKVMKSFLLTHLETNQFDKKKLDSFESTGKSISEVSYDFVIQTIWLHKLFGF